MTLLDPFVVYGRGRGHRFLVPCVWEGETITPRHFPGFGRDKHFPCVCGGRGGGGIEGIARPSLGRDRGGFVDWDR